ncbi:MAG TPA: hypothetical protein VG603_05480 [Chitinophagales bacterium]|nr:hypothetical protein [Chitinophagales bacterium]
MKNKLMLVALLLVIGISFSFGQSAPDKKPAYDSIILFPCGPNPADTKCLIRTYLPENDPFSSIRILGSDSTLVTEISLAKETGISSVPLNVSDWKEGSYYYQLFYKGETRQTLPLKVKH